MQLVDPAVAAEYKFENGAKWKEVALLGNFGVPIHWC